MGNLPQGSGWKSKKSLKPPFASFIESNGPNFSRVTQTLKLRASLPLKTGRKSPERKFHDLLTTSFQVRHVSFREGICTKIFSTKIRIGPHFLNPSPSAKKSEDFHLCGSFSVPSLNKLSQLSVDWGTPWRKETDLRRHHPILFTRDLRTYSWTQRLRFGYYSLGPTTRHRKQNLHGWGKPNSCGQQFGKW